MCSSDLKAVGMELCPALGISIPVGKDSLSMRTQWADEVTKEKKAVTSPVSLIISAFAPVTDTRQTTTPLLQVKDEQGAALDTEIVLIDLGRAKSRMAGSILAQVIDQAGQSTPDLDDPQDLKNLAAAIIKMRRQGLLLAYHDRSDGGLFAAATEMAFAAHVGVSLNVDMLVLDKDHESDFGDAKNWAQQVSGRKIGRAHV